MENSKLTKQLVQSNLKGMVSDGEVTEKIYRDASSKLQKPVDEKALLQEAEQQREADMIRKRIQELRRLRKERGDAMLRREQEATERERKAIEREREANELAQKAAAELVAINRAAEEVEDKIRAIEAQIAPFLEAMQAMVFRSLQDETRTKIMEEFGKKSWKEIYDISPDDMCRERPDLDITKVSELVAIFGPSKISKNANSVRSEANILAHTTKTGLIRVALDHLYSSDQPRAADYRAYRSLLEKTYDLIVAPLLSK